MNRFFLYSHPAALLAFFAVATSLTLFLNNPVIIILSACSASVNLIFYELPFKKGRFMLFLIPVMAVAALINPLFNRQGVTLLFYLPTGGGFYLESLFYGIHTALMLFSVTLWFVIFTYSMTGSKINSLLGRAFKGLTVIFIMTLRFIPMLLERISLIRRVHYPLGEDTKKSLRERLKSGLEELSILITWSLEESMDTAASMKARGFSLEGKTRSDNFSLAPSDKFSIVISGTVFFGIILGAAKGFLSFSFFPAIRFPSPDFLSAFLYGTFFLFCLMPIFLSLREGYLWRLSKSKA